MSEQTLTATPSKSNGFSHESPAWLLAATGDGKGPSYLVDLDQFQGPMELLLYLIRKDELDINDIPIARITKQYLEYVELMHELDLEAAGDFVLMAATLIRIKAKMLLPRDEVDEDEVDPREELVMALLEYKRFSEAGESLRGMREEEEKVFVPERKPLKLKGDTIAIPGNTVFQLIDALKEIIARANAQNDRITPHEPVYIEDRVKRIVAILTDKDSATFAELFDDAHTKRHIIVTFIAVLEMVNGHRLRVNQARPFDELRVYRGERFYDPGEIIVDEWSGYSDSAESEEENETVEESETVTN